VFLCSKKIMPTDIALWGAAWIGSIPFIATLAQAFKMCRPFE